MLTELRIRNFAIIDAVVLPLAPGLNVLSGETGAGKSIIVGALGLLIGERATADMVRTGADRAVVEGTFDIGAAAELRALLDERGIDCDEGTLVLRREVSATSGARARAWINGTAVTATVLADIGRALVNVHGQHEAQSLLDPEAQRRILDAFAGALAQADTVARAHAALTAARHAVAQLKARRDDAQRRADYLQHVAREIGDALLVEGEEQRLDDEARRLTHAEELRALAGEITGVLEGEETSVLHQLGTLQRALGALQRIDPSVARLQELYDAAYYALQELVREATAYGEGIEHDPARLAELERRRDLVFRLVKKYGGSIASVLETGREARAELALLDTAALDLRELDARVSAAVAALQEAAAGLTTARRQAASLLEQQVEAQFSGARARRGQVPRAARAARRDRRRRRRGRRVPRGAQRRSRGARAVARRLGRRAIARDAGAQDHPRARRSRADAHLRRGGRRHRRQGGAAGGRRHAPRRRASPGVRHHAPAADRVARAPPHPRAEGGQGRRDDGRHRGAGGRRSRGGDRAHAGRRRRQRHEPRTRPRTTGYGQRGRPPAAAPATGPRGARTSARSPRRG